MSKLNVFKNGYHNWKHPIYNVARLFQNCKYAWQRFTMGYSDLDILDLVYSKTSDISTYMQQFANESNGWFGDINKVSNINFCIEYQIANKIADDWSKLLFDYGGKLEK